MIIQINCFEFQYQLLIFFFFFWRIKLEFVSSAHENKMKSGESHKLVVSIICSSFTELRSTNQ